jgi:probable HAF family extracellular repeat protein
MQDLGTLPGDAGAWANGISGDGQVVVGATYKVRPNYLVEYYKAVRWDVASGTITDLGSLGGTISEAYAANRDGSVIVGSSQLIDGQTHAFRWTEAGGMQDLDKTPGNSSVANDVNADGSVVVGYSGDTAFRWTEPTGMISLGVLSGQSYSYATHVSDDGETVIGDSGGRAFIWNAAFGTPAGVIQDLDHLQTSLIQSADTVNHLMASQQRRLLDLNQSHCQPGAAQQYCLGLDATTYQGQGNQRNLQSAGGLRLNEHYTVGVSAMLGASSLDVQKRCTAQSLCPWFVGGLPTKLGCHRLGRQRQRGSRYQRQQL